MDDWCLWVVIVVMWLHNQWGSVYVGRAVNNKILVALSAIGALQASATEDTAAAIEQLLDYVATYPSDVILFRKSDMILAAHADAGL